MWRGRCRPFEVRSPVERPQGSPRPFCEGSQWRRQPGRAISPLDAPPDQAGSGGLWPPPPGTGPGRRGGWAGRGADRAWAPAGVVSASADFPASASICAMGRAREAGHGDPGFSVNVSERRAAPTLAQLRGGNNEECPPGGNHVPFGALGCPVWLRGSFDPGWPYVLALRRPIR